MAPGTNKLSFGLGSDNLHFTLDSTQFMGEQAAGVWTATISTTSYASAVTYAGNNYALPASIPTTFLRCL